MEQAIVDWAERCMLTAPTSDVRKSLKDGCKASPLSFFSSPASHSGHRWVFLSSTQDLPKTEPASHGTTEDRPGRQRVEDLWGTGGRNTSVIGAQHQHANT